MINAKWMRAPELDVFFERTKVWGTESELQTEQPAYAAQTFPVRNWTRHCLVDSLNCKFCNVQYLTQKSCDTRPS